MKLLLYSDIHISRTSSILPTLANSKYTYRQQMIMDTGKFLANLAIAENVDMIINLGDTFDQHTVSSYDIETASQFFKCFKNLRKPHYVLVGNHEMINQDFNAIELLDNIDNITVIDEPDTLYANSIMSEYALHTDNNADNNISLAFLPYCDCKDILELPGGDFLFSHQDIQGSTIRGDFKLPDGIEPNVLSKYRLVFNGHIHKPSIMGNVVNVGSTVTHSFSDDNDSVPQCYVFDTETLNLKTFKPAICPLFRKFEIQQDIAELDDYLNHLDKSYKYILQVVCPFELKEQVKKLLDNDELILVSRLSVKVNREETKETVSTESIDLQNSNDVNKSFIEFLDTVDTLKYPKQLYLEILKEVK